MKKNQGAPVVAAALVALIAGVTLALFNKPAPTSDKASADLPAGRQAFVGASAKVEGKASSNTAFVEEMARTRAAIHKELAKHPSPTPSVTPEPEVPEPAPDDRDARLAASARRLKEDLGHHK